MATRLSNWDYRSKGWYFITICTNNRINFFGNIYNNKLELNKVGKILKHFWQNIPFHFDNVAIDKFIIMPDHIHGLLFIHKDPEDLKVLQDNSRIQSKNLFFSSISPKSKSISTIIRSFKSICTREINKSFPDIKFEWQGKFYDRIIRSEYELMNVRNYIINNPKNFDIDKEDKF